MELCLSFERSDKSGIPHGAAGGSVDWLRFWLKGEEDPDPAKVEQYARWRELRKLQEENEKKSPAPAN